jgi:4-amino-4-deoxy-L-arabinose transferase-like glycosyltransferase
MSSIQNQGAQAVVSKRSIWIIVASLLFVQAIQVFVVVHRESLTFDEDDHMFAGFMMLHSGDYGLNPEHPPLVKILAALPVLLNPAWGNHLWIPPLQGREFKSEAYLDGRDWLARNDGDRQQIVLAMRLAAGLLTLGLSLTVFFAAREWFGVETGILALLLLTFDPNILAHSALVTTDMGVSCFFLASIFAFYRYIKKPTLARLLIAGVIAGLLISTKHSGILLAPMLILLATCEVFVAPRNYRLKQALRLSAALAAIVVVGVVVLWAFYGFRYAARPAGLALSTSLANYTAPLSHFDSVVVLTFARFHLLPESYLMGLVDVKRMAQFYPTYIFGKVYAHGQWWYFPAVILIKTTLGLLGLCLISLLPTFTGLQNKRRELVYLLLPGVVYFAVAVASGMNIGARHILPLYAMAAIFAAAGLTALYRSHQTWARNVGRLGVVFVLLHIVSALFVFPNYMAYANELAGGPANIHNLLSDANLDWAQQLYQVKEWQDRHPNQECWFAYFARPEVDPATYGIHCHALPTVDTMWLGGEENVSPTINGYLLLSAGDLSGCEWPSNTMNPYHGFQSLKPDEQIDYSVMVYHGRFDIHQAAALARAENAWTLLGSAHPHQALALAQEAVQIDPTEITSQTALGDSYAALSQKEDARKAWQSALQLAQKLEPDAQPSYIPDLQAKIKSL